MNSSTQRISDRSRRELGWPAAATLITAMVGAAVTTVAWAIVPPEQVQRAVVEYVSQREIGEVKARLTAIEESHRQMRAELRSDIQELRKLVQQLLKQG